MPPVDRRSILLACASMPLTLAGVWSADIAQAAENAPSPALSAPAAKNVTRALARYIVGAKYEDLPLNVRKQGVRTLLNWVGVTIGGSHQPAVDIAVSALTAFSGPPQASLLGRRERFDILNASFLNGVASHILDFDDTHLKTIIHPAGPVVPAILALAEMQPVDGKDFLNALVLGVETECRIGNAVYPKPDEPEPNR
jgi:2-methylcitrate dehydratase PrpD